MSVRYVHTLGDSTLDNLYWTLERNAAEQAKKLSVEGQLQEKLNAHSSASYEVVSHAYDGFTTSSVLCGGYVGRVLRIWPGKTLHGFEVEYLKGKNIDPAANSYYVHPMNDLRKSLKERPSSTHYVVLSVGGNDFRERLGNPLAMLGQIPNIHARYQRILKELTAYRQHDPNVKPILVFQYRLDTHNDIYQIYKVMKIMGLFTVAAQTLSALAVAASVAVLTAGKINVYLGGALLLASAAFLGLSGQLPFKITQGVLMGQEAGMTTLGVLMETFYRPILEQAKKDRIPVLDLPNTFNPHDRLFISQIEPNEKGSALIAEGLTSVIKAHDFDEESVLYSMSDFGYVGHRNSDPASWHVAYPKKPPTG